VFLPIFMIVELLIVLLLFISFTGWGIWIKFLLSVKNESVSLTILLGLAFFSIWVCIISFFAPLIFFVESLLFIVSIFPFFLKKFRPYFVQIPTNILKSIPFWIFSLIILLAGSYFPFRPDHFWYYIPTLNWLNQYGLIIGVANIDWVLGQMSFLHIIQAGLDNSLDPFQRINIFISILFLVYLFERKAFWLLLFIPFYFLFIQTTSPDIAVVFLSLIVANELCFNYNKNSFRILLIISIFVFTIKPIAFWLPAWVFIMAVYFDKKDCISWKNYVFPILLIFLFLIKSALASSVLCFPLSMTKIDTYWLTDMRILDISNQNAALYTFDMHFNKEEVNAFSFFKKLYYWLTIRDLQTIINLFIVAVTLLFGIFAFWKKRFAYKALWFIVLFKIAITFYYSGQYRFMLDGIYPLLFILLCSFRIKKPVILAGSLIFFFAALTFISCPELIKTWVPGFKLSDRMEGFTKNSLLRPENQVLEAYKKEKLGNLEFYISTDFIYNFDTPPPAFVKRKLKQCLELGIFPQMKDAGNIHKGFYMKTLSEDEKEKLAKIIADCD
jgi:hypothetical protein